jgi:hypothetical protein
MTRLKVNNVNLYFYSLQLLHQWKRASMDVTIDITLIIHTNLDRTWMELAHRKNFIV